MISPGLDHVGIVVPDVAAAAEELSATFGFTWARPPAEAKGAVLMMQRHDSDEPEPIRITSVSSVEYPRIELIQNNPGTCWEIDGSGFVLHHIALWSSDLKSDSKKIVTTCPMEIYGVDANGGAAPTTFTYQRMQKGLLFELLEDANGGQGERRMNLGCVTGG